MSTQLVDLNILSKDLNVDFAGVNNTNRSDQTFSRVFERITTVMKGRFNPKDSGSENIADNTGSKYNGSVELLRKFLMGSGVPLEKMYISREGIPALEKFLSCCGFSKSDVHRLINDLLNADHGTKRKINMLELFSKLSDLGNTVERKKKDPVLEASLIPYLEVGLHRLGVKTRDLEKALSEGKTENGDLNLESFLQSLKRIAKNINRGTPSVEVAEDIKRMFSHLGMEEELKGAISLDKFVQLLEKSVSKMTKSNLPKQDIEKSMEGLIGEVVVDSEENDSKSQLKSLTAQRMIDGLLAKGSKGKHKGTDAKESTPSPDTRIDSHKRGEKGAVQKVGSDIISTDVEKFSKILGNRSDNKEHAATQGGDKNIHVSHVVAESRPAAESIKAAQPSASPSSRSLPLYMVDQVSRQITRSVMQGENNIRLRLKPPHLGTVKLEMGMNGNVLKLNIAAEHHATRELLLSYVQELKQSLAEQGIRLERMDVHSSYQFGQSMENAHKEFNGEGHRARGRRGTSAVFGIEKGDEEIDAVISRGRMDAALDLIA